MKRKIKNLELKKSGKILFLPLWVPASDELSRIEFQIQS